MSKPVADKGKGRAYGGVSALQRRELRRAKFLQAGLEVFGRQGYRAATVRMLCKQAGLTDRYFYESFADTEALLKAVYQQQMNRLQGELMRAIGRHQGELRDRIRLAVGVFLDFVHDPLVARIALTEVLGVSASIDQIYQINTQNFGAFIMSQARTEFPHMQLAADQEKMLGTALAGACAMSAAHWLIEKYASPKESAVDACTAVLMGTLRELAEPA